MNQQKVYKVNLEWSDNNNVFYLINNISTTSFQINTILLDFIASDNKHNWLYNPNIDHEYVNLDKKTKYQNNIYKLYNSRVLLQEFILKLAHFYKNFNEIYFPVRIVQRGRLYYTPNLFNYQSNELSKSLILFSNCGIINNND